MWRPATAPAARRSWVSSAGRSAPVSDPARCPMTVPRVLQLPRSLARRVGVNLARLQHALQPPTSDIDALERALAPGEDVGSLIASFRAGTEARFFFERQEAAGLSQHLARVVPGWRERTVADG